MNPGKRELRKSLLARARALPEEEISGRSRKIILNLSGLPEWLGAGVILAFLPLPGEVDTEPLLTLALGQGKRLALPRMRDGELDFHLVEDLSCGWITHAWGVREPAPGQPVLDLAGCGERMLAIVPGAAFARDCSRLGRGGGFYDRFLGKAGGRVISAGVCFSFQLLEEVPAEPHDRPVDLLVTDTEVLYRLSPQAAPPA